MSCTAPFNAPANRVPPAQRVLARPTHVARWQPKWAMWRTPCASPLRVRQDVLSPEVEDRRRQRPSRLDRRRGEPPAGSPHQKRGFGSRCYGCSGSGPCHQAGHAQVGEHACSSMASVYAHTGEFSGFLSHPAFALAVLLARYFAQISSALCFSSAVRIRSSAFWEYRLCSWLPNLNSL